MSKMNCWEFMKCEREPGGANAAELGVCPATVDETYNGVLGGKNGGRCCWIISGTVSNGEIQGTFARKFGNCKNCDFYVYVYKGEG
jgi:hypothetical protein